MGRFAVRVALQVAQFNSATVRFYAQRKTLAGLARRLSQPQAKVH
jgi:hypothetical protein